MSVRRPANSSAPRYSGEYAADHSPLQQVEKIIGGMSKEMSKEEKRARLQEAEERLAGRSSKDRSSLGYSGSRDSRYDNRYDSRYNEPYSPTDPAQPRSARTSTTRDDNAVPRIGTIPSHRGASNAPTSTPAEPYSQISNNSASAPGDRDVNRRRSDGFPPRVLRKPAPSETRAVSDSYGQQPPARQRSVREGRVFDSDQGYDNHNGNTVPAGWQSRDFPTGDSAGSRRELGPRDGMGYDSATSSQHQSPKLKDRITGLFKRNRKSQVQPQQSRADGRRDENVEPEQHHELDRASSQSSDDLRRFEPTKYRDYRKEARTARIPVEDNVAKTPTSATQPDQYNTWWEKSAQSSSGKRRASGPQATGPEGQSSTANGSYERYQQQPGAQTWFQPQLYLKSGPLLRFTGIRKSPRSGRELWSGSVMIVTIDSKSSYQQPPNLRIFKQPVELLPPPPQHIDEASGQHLSPEYVDPIAGQIKMSRVGKTLYVKPVEALEEHRDLSRVEDDTGLFEELKSSPSQLPTGKGTIGGLRPVGQDGELRGQFQDLAAYILHKERGVTFWRWNLEIELSSQQTRLAYRINRGPAIGFWVPARGEMMNLMFHSCNGFSLSVDSSSFSGPDPLWRDVLNSHQTKPFHLMIGGGDQIYNDAVTVQTRYFAEWARSKNMHHKNNMPFSVEMQNELELFYLNRYSMWFSQGLFGMANSQIPMVNMWDDHDIIDGFGSYPDHTMRSPVMSGVGNVAFKYYMLFQHQSLPIEDEKTEPSWLLGAQPGPYITERSRSLFMWLGHGVALLSLDCRTERARDEVLSQDTWDLVFNRLHREIVQRETRHLIVLLGIPIAYPRLNFLENVLTSRALDPVKALGRTGALGGFVNKFDGGVEILDDLDDHWTAKHHKAERNWLIQELQALAAEKSVRITILGGDVHLAAVGQFYSQRELGLPKDEDHRYMPNVISSAIVNTPPSDMLADVLNKRNKIHHLDEDTDEDMIPMFPEDVNNKARNNKHLLPRRNWCSIHEYMPNTTPPQTPSPPTTPSGNQRPGVLSRALTAGSASSLPGAGLLRRLSTKGRSSHPPIAYQQRAGDEDYFDRRRSTDQPRRSSADMARGPVRSSDGDLTHNPRVRPNPFLRRPTVMLPHKPTHMINLQGALDIRINCENEQGDPAGTTTDYRLIVPALDYRGPGDRNPEAHKPKGNRLTRLLSVGGSRGRDQRYADSQESMASPPVRQQRRFNESFDSLQPEAATQRRSEYPNESPTLGSNGLPLRTRQPQLQMQPPPQSQPQQRPTANTSMPANPPTNLPGPPPGPAPSMRNQTLPGPPPGPPPTSNKRRSEIPTTLPGPPPGPPPKTRTSLPGPPPGLPPQSGSVDPRYAKQATNSSAQRDAGDQGYFARAPRRQSADARRQGEGGFV